MSRRSSLEGHPLSLVVSLYHPEQRRHDIHCTVSLLPQRVQLREPVFNVSLHACLDHLLDDHRVRLVTDFEDVVSRDESEAGERGLEVVDSLPHVPFRGEDQSRKPVIGVADLSQ